jgi:predicted GTPase
MRPLLSKRSLFAGVVGAGITAMGGRPAQAIFNKQEAIERMTQGADGNYDYSQQAQTDEAVIDKKRQKGEEFQESMKKYKKEWKVALAELRFADGDAATIEATKACIKLIVFHNFEVPDGTQRGAVKRIIADKESKLGKEARMDLLQLDKLVYDATNVNKDKEPDTL